MPTKGKGKGKGNGKGKGKRKGKGKGKKQASANKQAAYIFQKYASLIPKRVSRKTKKGYDMLQKPLREMVAGDLITCGSDHKYGNHVLQQIRFICFLCPKEFPSIESKIDHMLSCHGKSEKIRICRVCLCPTEAPEYHEYLILNSMVDVLGSSQSEDSSGGNNSHSEISGSSIKELIPVGKVREPEADEDEEENRKRRLNLVFIGHLDAGKSTTVGRILRLSGLVDNIIIQGYAEEHVKGKTAEVGMAYFETESARFSILDAPGHENYVPNMIMAASQADIGVLVISARKGEFEAGYEKGGQTREHAMLAKSLGVSRLTVVITKMDHVSVNWAMSRYNEIHSKMVPFLKAVGYNVDKDIQFVPISGLLGSNIEVLVDRKTCDWWNGPCFLSALDKIEVPLRDPNRPVRMPITDKYKKKGAVVMGRIEYGTIRKGDSLLVMPNKENVKVLWIRFNEDMVTQAGPAENVKVKLSGVEAGDILSGFVLCSISNPVMAVTEFTAHVKIFGLRDNTIFTAGFNGVLHIHSVIVECQIIELIEEIDNKKKKDADPKINQKRKPHFVRNGSLVVCKIQVNNLICIECFSDFPQLGRFILRAEGKTIAVGKVVKLPI